MNPNYSPIHMPIIKDNVLGLTTNRLTLRIPAKNSAALYLGSFVSDATDSGTVGTAVAGGVKAFSGANDLILGFVSGFTRNGTVPIQDDSKYKGTITNATGELPMKYTFTSNNDVTNSTPDMEMVEITPIWDGDVLEVALWGGSTTSVARGTTTNSDKLGASFPVNTTYTFALTESSVVAAGSTMTAVQFREVLIAGQQPVNPNHVYVRCIRSSLTWRCYQ